MIGEDSMGRRVTHGVTIIISILVNKIRNIIREVSVSYSQALLRSALGSFNIKSK